jgi:ribonuclease III
LGSALSSLATNLGTRIGYHLKDHELLQQALTHGSKSKKAKNYERLEFLGDRVLGLVIAEALYSKHAKEPEGKLAARHSALVRGEICAAVGRAMGLDEFIILGDSERRSGLQHSVTVLGDAAEALIGAVYLEAGLTPARSLILKFWTDFIDKPDTATKDAKTFVQEWVLSRALPLPRYELVSQDGPDHKPHFVIDIMVDQFPAARGEGANKRAAEMHAAMSFIAREGLR